MSSAYDDALYTDDALAERLAGDLWRQLWGYTRPYRAWVWGLCACAVVVASTRDCGVGRSYVPQRLVVSFAPSSRTRRWNARSSVRSRSRAAGLCGNQPVS